MAANKRPRKPYRPRPALLRPITVAVGADDARTLKLLPHDELRKLREGQGTEYTFNTLACRLNVGYTMAAHLFTGDAAPALKAALDALVAVKERHGARGTWIATGDELKALGTGLVLTDEMQDNTTRREHRDAIRKVFAEAAT